VSLIERPDARARGEGEQPIPSGRSPALIGALLCLLIGATAAVVFLWTRPGIGEATYQFQGRSIHTAVLPFFVPAESDRVVISFSIDRPRLSPTTFLIRPYDCIEQLIINNVPVDPGLAAFCAYPSPRSLNLSDYLRRGRNDVRVVVRNQGKAGGLDFEVSWVDLLSMVLVGACAAAVVGLCFAVSRIWWGHDFDQQIFSVALAGSFLRILYAFATPYMLRGHDTGSHVAYIKYIAEHLRIPPASGGEEFFQAPLYYTLTGLYMRARFKTGHDVESILRQIKGFSLLLSIVSFLLVLWVGTMLFDVNKQRRQFFLYAFILATMPSLVYLSSRISNEVLCQPLIVLSFGLLLSWWKRSDIASWYTAILTISVGMTAKVTAAVLLPVGFVCVLAKHRSSVRTMAWLLILSAAMVAVIAGWLPVERLIAEPEPDRARSLSFGEVAPQLTVPRHAANLLVFNPIAVLNHPENNAWTDTERRQFFWEYFFKSAFFGEFGFNASLALLERLILIVALLSLPLVAIGIVDELRRPGPRTLPLYATGFVLLASSVWYGTRFPFAPNQDFRFVTLLTVPIACAAIRGASCLRGAGATLAEGLLASMAALCAFFLVLLAFVR
jgi:hypothetical protein